MTVTQRVEDIRLVINDEGTTTLEVRDTNGLEMTPEFLAQINAGETTALNEAISSAIAEQHETDDASYAKLVSDWVTARAYVVGELVVSGGVIYRCKTAHTSAGSFDASKFDSVSPGSVSDVATAISDAVAAQNEVDVATYGRTAYDLRVAMPLGTTADIHALITAAIAAGHKYIVVPYNATPWPATSCVTAAGVTIEFEPGAKVSLNMTSGAAMVLTARSHLIGASFTSPYTGPSSAEDASDSGHYAYMARGISIGDDCTIRDFDQEYCSGGILVAGARTVIERAYIRNIRMWRGWGSALHRDSAASSYGLVRDVLIEDCDRGLETESGASYNLVERVRQVRIGPNGYTGQPVNYEVYTFVLDSHSHDGESPCIGNVYKECEVVDSMGGISTIRSNGTSDAHMPRDNYFENITIEGYTGTAGYPAVYLQGHNNRVKNLRLKVGSGVASDAKMNIVIADGNSSHNRVEIAEASAYVLPLVKVGTGNTTFDNRVSLTNVSAPTAGTTGYLVDVFGPRTRVEGSIRGVTGTTGYFRINSAAADTDVSGLDYGVDPAETFAQVALVSGAPRVHLSRWRGTSTPATIPDIATSGGVLDLVVDKVTVARTNGVSISLGAASSYCLVTDTCDLGGGTVSDAGTSNRIPRQGGSLDYESTLGRMPGLVASVLAGGSVALGTASQAVVVRMRADRALTIAKLRWMVGTQSGNYDIAVLDKAGTVLWAKGSTACPASGLVTETVTGAVIRPGDVYYLALVFDNTTATFKGITMASGDPLRTLGGTLRVTYVSDSFPFPSVGQTVTVGTTAGLRLPVITVHEV